MGGCIRVVVAVILIFTSVSPARLYAQADPKIVAKTAQPLLRVIQGGLAAGVGVGEVVTGVSVGTLAVGAIWVVALGGTGYVVYTVVKDAEGSKHLMRLVDPIQSAQALEACALGQRICVVGMQPDGSFVPFIPKSGWAGTTNYRRGYAASTLESVSSDEQDRRLRAFVSQGSSRSPMQPIQGSQSVRNQLGSEGGRVVDALVRAAEKGKKSPEAFREVLLTAGVPKEDRRALVGLLQQLETLRNQSGPDVDRRRREIERQFDERVGIEGAFLRVQAARLTPQPVFQPAVRINIDLFVRDWVDEAVRNGKLLPDEMFEFVADTHLRSRLREIVRQHDSILDQIRAENGKLENADPHQIYQLRRDLRGTFASFNKIIGLRVDTHSLDAVRLRALLLHLGNHEVDGKQVESSDREALSRLYFRLTGVILEAPFDIVLPVKGASPLNALAQEIQGVYGVQTVAGIVPGKLGAGVGAAVKGTQGEQLVLGPRAVILLPGETTNGTIEHERVHLDTQKMERNGEASVFSGKLRTPINAAGEESADYAYDAVAGLDEPAAYARGIAYQGAQFLSVQENRHPTLSDIFPPKTAGQWYSGSFKTEANTAFHLSKDLAEIASQVSRETSVESYPIMVRHRGIYYPYFTYFFSIGLSSRMLLYPVLDSGSRRALAPFAGLSDAAVQHQFLNDPAMAELREREARIMQTQMAKLAEVLPVAAERFAEIRDLAEQKRYSDAAQKSIELWEWMKAQDGRR